MRWAYEKVDFEPAGKDHHSQGGSFDTSRLVCKDLYGYNAPVSFRYVFIGIKGRGGKMSSSSGEVVDLRELLRVYTPELVRYLFAGTRPNTEFTISFDLDVIKIYEDYDRTERIAFKTEPAKNETAYIKERCIYELSQVGEIPDRIPYQVPFRHLCNLLQISDGDITKMISGLPGVRGEHEPRIRERATCAKVWLDEFAPEEFKFTLRNPGEKSDCLSEVELRALKNLRDMICAHKEYFRDDRACSDIIYKTAEMSEVDGKVIFRATYQALIGKDQGPRLSNFLRVIGSERLLDILSAY
jgi:lysyl-tRNA synthetase class 1